MWTFTYPDLETDLPLTNSLLHTHGHVLMTSSRDGDGSVHSIDPKSGAPRRRFRAGSGISGLTKVGDLLLADPYGPSGSWYAVDPERGEERWRSAPPPESPAGARPWGRTTTR